MTSPILEELTTFVAGTKSADEEDAPVLLAIVRKLREDEDLRYEAIANALEAMARRMTERHRVACRFDERGLLDETSSLAIVDLHEDEGPWPDVPWPKDEE